uniref:Uncharacterized protein n=1 Tax=Arundo donax TaxID=35708 RepID=A0A0A9D8Z1_ARUDO
MLYDFKGSYYLFLLLHLLLWDFVYVTKKYLVMSTD